jgi:hypothetical protein
MNPFPTRGYQIALVCVTLFCSLSGFAQKFAPAVNVGYAIVKLKFPAKADPYHEAEIESFQSPTFGAGFHMLVTNQFRIGFGLHYLAFKGERSGGQIQRAALNPNQAGEFTISVDNSYLFFPVFTQLVFGKSKVRPMVTAGINFFKPLKLDMQMGIEPDQHDTFYPTYSTTIDKSNSKSQYLGAFFGTGVVFAPGEGTREFSLTLFREFNKSFYFDITDVANEGQNHQIRQYNWVLRLGYQL